MKKFLEFYLLRKEPKNRPLNGYLAAHVFERVAMRFPELISKSGVCLDVKLLEGDPKLDEIFAFLKEELGLRPMPSLACRKKQKPGDYSHFTVKTSYEFDDQDIEGASFLYTIASEEIGCDGTGGKDWDQWGLEKAAKKLPVVGALGCLSGLVCTAATRSELEQESFQGLGFLPVIVHDPRYHQNDFWCIWANRTMPKVSMPLCDQEGNPVKDDYSTGCMPDEIIVNQVILKYNATDLTAMNGTDFALTAEKWGTPKDRGRREELVVSQRFRQWCLKKNVQMNWTPVIALPD